MSVFDEQPPLINHKELCQWLKNNYSFFKIKDVKLRSLNSERDINFLIKGINNKKYVVKISNPKESFEQLMYQDVLIKHLRLNKKLRKKLNLVVPYYPSINLHTSHFFLS